MTEEARQARNAYKREWNRKNKDKVKHYQDKHWQKVADEKRAEEEAKGIRRSPLIVDFTEKRRKERLEEWDRETAESVE